MKFSWLIGIHLFELLTFVCARPAFDDDVDRSSEYQTVASRACRDRCRQVCVKFGGQKCVLVCVQQCARPVENEISSVELHVFKPCPPDRARLWCLHGGVCYDSGMGAVLGRRDNSYGCMCAQCYRGARCEHRLLDCEPVRIVLLDSD